MTEAQQTRFTGYPVTLPVFEGPLDLLLYLIRRQEIDIYDIPMATITARFLDYIALMEELDIEVAADFLLMAATLLEIKSRMLLPRQTMCEETLEEEDIDPRAELVRKLLAYQQFKLAASDLQRRSEERKLLFPRNAVVPHLTFAHPDPALAGNLDGFSLWAALQEVLARIEAVGPTLREVARPKVTLRQQMVYILRQLELSPGGLAFSRIFFQEEREDPPTRLEVIVTFLALLELMRLHRVLVSQDAVFGAIRLLPVQANIPYAGPPTD
ncbi:MAG TPA: segregation/condensation protein A [Armatimonadota bacterium]